MFIGYSPIIDGVVILISSFLFWIIHVPQYKGIYVAYAIVFINGLVCALLFYYTGSLIPAILVHAIYNLGIGIYFIKEAIRFTIHSPLQIPFDYIKRMFSRVRD